MKFRKFQLALLATALGGAMGIASAQGTGMSTDAGSSSSVGTTAAGSKAAASYEGNAALTQEAQVSSSITAGSPGTQSGVAVTDTTTMGASASSQSYASLGTSPSLSRTQARLLQRYEALR